MLEQKWYFANNYHYLRIEIYEKDETILCCQDESLINFWVNEICAAIRFYQWLQ